MQRNRHIYTRERLRGKNAVGERKKSDEKEKDKRNIGMKKEIEWGKKKGSSGRVVSNLQMFQD